MCTLASLRTAFNILKILFEPSEPMTVSLTHKQLNDDDNNNDKKIPRKI